MSLARRLLAGPLVSQRAVCSSARVALAAGDGVRTTHLSLALRRSWPDLIHRPGAASAQNFGTAAHVLQSNGSASQASPIKPRPIKASDKAQGVSPQGASAGAGPGGPKHTVASAERALAAARRKKLLVALLLALLAAGAVFEYARSNELSFLQALRRIWRQIYRFYGDTGRPLLADGSAGNGPGTASSLTREELIEAEAELEGVLRSLLPNRDKVEDRENSRDNKDKEKGKEVEHTAVEADSFPELDLTPTVVLVFEGLLAHSTYHPQYGFQAIPRPKLAEHLLALGDTGCEIIIWSKTRPASSAETVVHEKWTPEIMSLDRYRFMAFQRHLKGTLYRQYVEKYGTEEGAEFYAESSMGTAEVDAQYLQACLHLTGILGREHILPFSSPPSAFPSAYSVAATAGDKASPGAPRIDLLPRPRRNVLVVDCSTSTNGSSSTAMLFPNNTLLLPSVEDELKREGTSDEQEAVCTLEDVATFVSLYRTAAEQRLRTERARAKANATVNTGDGVAAGADVAEEAVMAQSETISDWLAYFRRKTTAAGEDLSSIQAWESSARVLDAARRIGQSAASTFSRTKKT